MTITGPHLIGVVVIALAFYGTVLLVLIRQPRPIKWFAIALVTVGVGYLSWTEAPAEIARALLGAPE
jgi:drug/metabolite transporter (DMT)-like permease